MSENSHQVSEEQNLWGKPTLYVPKGYGDVKSVGGGAILGRDLQEELKELSFFSSIGFQIIHISPSQAGKFDWNNPYSIGIAIDSLPYINSDTLEYYKLGKRRAMEAGVSIIPSAASWRDILTTSTVFVAKDRAENAGSGKYLLDTQKAKEQFLLVHLLGQKIFYFPECVEKYYKTFTPEHTQMLIEDLKDAIRKNGHHPLIDEEQANYYIDQWHDFEEFVETPTDYFTSLKVLVDYRGTIYYRHMYASYAKKASRQQSLYRPREFSNHKHLSNNPWDCSSNDRKSFLHNPNSPFYYPFVNILASPRSAYNTYDLSLSRWDKEKDRQFLEAHDLDPDNLQLPVRLEDDIRTLGIINRDRAPYLTTDFLFDVEIRTWKFLECNAGPDLDRRYLGLPQSASGRAAHFAMLRKIFE